MSRVWKQTKIDMGAWKKLRPGMDDLQDPAQEDPSLADAPSSLKTSLQPALSTSSLSHLSPGSSSPSSTGTSNAPPLQSHPELQSSTVASDVSGAQKPAVPNPSAFSHNAPLTATNLSFTSSQLPSSSGSQRIMRNGERMVTNSDEDNDSSSLEDLDDLIRLKEPHDSHNPPEQMNESRLRSATIKYTSNNRRKVHISSAVPITPNYKYSLDVLIEQQKQLEKSEGNVARANAALEARGQGQPMNGQTVKVTGLPNESVIDAVLSHTGDEEEIGRLKDALRRTEALHQDYAWSFFHANVHRDTSPPDFPDLKDHPLQHILRDPSSRQQAFLNGYIEDFAMKNDLPNELLNWIMESTQSETREDLRRSYVQILSEIGSRRDLLTPSGVNGLFRSMGARDEALDMETPIVPDITDHTDAEGVTRDRLLTTLTLIQNLANSLRPDARLHTICILCRLLLDNQVLYDCNLTTALDDSLSSLIESIPETSYESVVHEALVKVYESVKDPRLRLQLISYLPVYDFRTAVFRRRLALAFFFEDTKFFTKPVTEAMVDLDSIATYLLTPRFKITRKTDYTDLTTSLAMLDIGIDAGDPLLPFATTKDERHFDEAVDRLSVRLKDISSQIVGTSTLDMRRTEAKEILHAMQRRLTYAVRSRPYVKKSFLVDSATDHHSEKKGMSEYLKSTQVDVAESPMINNAGASIKNESMYTS